MKADELRAGQGWARFSLGFGVALSITGNVAHTVLADSGVSLWLRIPFAVVWPVALFLAVEVLVRVRWTRSALSWFGRIVLLLPVSVVAAVVSWLHLHHLMKLAGEVPAANIIGPLAVDGLMIGATVALLVIRAHSLIPITEQPEPAPEIVPASVMAEQATEVQQELLTALPIAAAPRQPRAPKEAQEKAVRMLLEGASVENAAAATAVGASTLRRYAKAQRELLADPAAQIDPTEAKINSALLEIIRAWANTKGRTL